jgi:hypothetical protein
MSLKENRFKKRRTDFDLLFSSGNIESPLFNIGLAPMYGVGSASLVSAVVHGSGFAFHPLVSRIISLFCMLFDRDSPGSKLQQFPLIFRKPMV